MYESEKTSLQSGDYPRKARLVKHAKINGFHHTNQKFKKGKKEKVYKIILMVKEKASNKIQHPFLVIIFRKLVIEVNFLNLIEGIHNKTLDIINGKEYTDTKSEA